MAAAPVAAGALAGGMGDGTGDGLGIAGWELLVHMGPPYNGVGGELGEPGIGAGTVYAADQ
jgi:hypothetical protein